MVDSNLSSRMSNMSRSPSADEFLNDRPSKMSSSVIRRREPKLMELRRLQKTIMSKPVRQEYERKKLCRHDVVAKLNHHITDNDIEVSIFALNLLCGTVPRLTTKTDVLLLPMVPRIIYQLGHESKNVRSQSLRFLRVYFTHCINKKSFMELYVKHAFHNRGLKTRRTGYYGVNVIFDVDEGDEVFSFLVPHIAHQLESAPMYVHPSIFYALAKIHRLVGEERFYRYMNVCGTQIVSTYNGLYLGDSYSDQILSFNELMHHYQDRRQCLGLSNDYGILHPGYLEDIKNTTGSDRSIAVNRLSIFIRSGNWDELELEPHIIDMLSLINCFMADNQRRVQMEGLDILKVMIERFGIGLAPHLHQVVKGLNKLMLSMNPHIKHRCMTTMRKLMVNVHPMTVTWALLAVGRTTRNFFLREEILNVVQTTIKYFPYYDFDMSSLCQAVGQYLNDPVEGVKRASESCIMTLIKVMDGAPVEGLRGRTVFSLLSNLNLGRTIVDALDIRLPINGLGAASGASTETPSTGGDEMRLKLVDEQVDPLHKEEEYDPPENPDLPDQTLDVLEKVKDRLCYRETQTADKVRKKWASVLGNFTAPGSAVLVDPSAETNHGDSDMDQVSVTKHDPSKLMLRPSTQSNASPCSCHDVCQQSKTRKNWTYRPLTPNVCMLRPPLLGFATLEEEMLDDGDAPSSPETYNKEYDTEMPAYGADCSDVPESRNSFIGDSGNNEEQETILAGPDEAGDRDVVGRSLVGPSPEIEFIEDPCENGQRGQTYNVMNIEEELLNQKTFNFNIMQVDQRKCEESGNIVELSEDDDELELAENQSEIAQVFPTCIKEPDDVEDHDEVFDEPQIPEDVRTHDGSCRSTRDVNDEVNFSPTNGAEFSEIDDNENQFLSDSGMLTEPRKANDISTANHQVISHSSDNLVDAENSSVSKNKVGNADIVRGADNADVLKTGRKQGMQKQRVKKNAFKVNRNRSVHTYNARNRRNMQNKENDASGPSMPSNSKNESEPQRVLKTKKVLDESEHSVTSLESNVAAERDCTLNEVETATCEDKEHLSDLERPDSIEEIIDDDSMSIPNDGQGESSEDEKVGSEVSIVEDIVDAERISLDSLDMSSVRRKGRVNDTDKATDDNPKVCEANENVVKRNHQRHKAVKKDFVALNSKKPVVACTVDPKSKSKKGVDPKVAEVRRKWSTASSKKPQVKNADNRADAGGFDLGANQPKNQNQPKSTTTRKSTEADSSTKNRKSWDLRNNDVSREDANTPEARRASNQWKRELEYPMKGGTCPWVKTFDETVQNMEAFASCETAEFEIKRALDNLANNDWMLKEEAMVTLLRTAKYHPEIAQENMSKMILALCNEMKSLRQSVAGKAILTIGHLYLIGGKLLESKLRIIINALLNKSGNRTVACAYRLVIKSLFNLVRGSTMYKTALAFAAEGTRHPNKAARETAAQFLAYLLESLGPVKSLSSGMAASMLRCATIFMLDGSPLTRHCGKVMFSVFLQHPDFDNLKNRHIEPSNVRNITKILSSIKARGVTKEMLPIHVIDTDET